MNNKIKVLSLGGSLINDGQIDVNFLKDFRQLIFSLARRKFKFLIFCGGGFIARQYQTNLKYFSHKTKDLDIIGIQATYLNAKFLQLLLAKNVVNSIISSLKARIVFSKPIIIGAGSIPGFSTDFDAFYFAHKLKLTSVINISNIDYVYKLDSKSQKIPQKLLTWKNYLEIIKSQGILKWSPGLSVPIDPVAARFALKNSLKCIVCNGKRIKNLHKILIGSLDFIGTTIK